MKNLKETIQKKSENSYGVKIYDYLNSDWIYIGNKGTYEEAYKLHNEAQFKYYLNKRYLLPKCISLDKAKEQFIFAFRWNNKLHKKNYNSLQEALKEKRELMIKLMD